MQQQYLDVLEYLPESIATQDGQKYPLQVDMDGELLMLRYTTPGSNYSHQEFSLTMSEFLLKTERTFEVLGLLQAEMGKTQTGTLSFSNCESKLIHHAMRWFAEEKLLNFDQWRWSIKLNMQEPQDESYKHQIEQKVIDYWISKTKIASDQRYPKTVTYINNTPRTTLKDHYYGTLVLEYRNNLFSQIIKNFVKKVTYETVLTCELPLIRGFMRGIIAGDGCVNDHTISRHANVKITAVQENERIIFQQCLAKLDILSKIYNNYKDLVISQQSNLIKLLNQRLLTLSPFKYAKFLYMVQRFPHIEEMTSYFKPKGKNIWNKIPPEKIDKIIQLYQSGTTRTVTIAEQLGISPIKVNRVLRVNNLGKRVLPKISESFKQEIADFARNNLHLSHKKLSEHFQIHESTITRICKKYKIKKGNKPLCKIPEEKIQSIIQIYKENPISKIADISKKVGVSGTVIRRVRKENNLKHLGYMHLIGNNNRKYKDELLHRTSEEVLKT